MSTPRTSSAPRRSPSIFARFLRALFQEQLEEATEIAFPAPPTAAPATSIGWAPDLSEAGTDEFVRTGRLLYVRVPAPVAERRAA